ncbi:MAG: HAMP domain-containing protein [Candidatus Moranbacteria bacterium]|nr:HAMP domain-containing protein [Candidatus Moranbacteria bacterium]
MAPYFFVSCATFVIFFVFVYYNYTIRVESIHALQQEIALRAGAEINHYFESILSDLVATEKNISCIDCSDENKKIIQNFIDKNPSIYRAVLFDVSLEKKEMISRFGEEETTFSGYESFFKSEESRGSNEKVFLSSVYISHYGTPFMLMGIPVIDNQGQHRGSFLVELDLSPMWNTVSKIRVQKSGYVYVVDKDGKLIAYKDAALVQENKDLSLIEGVRHFLQSVHSKEIYPSFSGDEVIGNWHKINTVGWGLIAELPYAEIILSLRPLMIATGFSLFLFFISVVFMLMIIFRVILSPLKHLRDGVIDAEKNNLQQTIVIQGNDEIRDVSDAFNEMILRLREYYQTLEKKVADRTMQLERAKEDINRQLLEVEKLNELMIGREMKMIEMKKEISELKKNHQKETPQGS